MSDHQARFPVRVMSRLLGVSPSGFYAYKTRPPSKRDEANAVLLARVRRFHAESGGTYGPIRIVRDLREDKEAPIRVGKNRIARLMQRAGLRGEARRRFITTTTRDRNAIGAPDLVERDFTATGPNQLWVSDLTYIPTWSGFLYLSVVLDAWSRRIIGWSMQTSLATTGVLEALDMALMQRKPTNVIHHSDHGCQYTSLAFGKRCREMGVRPSMGSVGDAYDNAMCESFFATLEHELLKHRRFKTQAEARTAIFGFIEGFYNSRRRHSAIDYNSPINYERNYELMTQDVATA